MSTKRDRNPINSPESHDNETHCRACDSPCCNCDAEAQARGRKELWNLDLQRETKLLQHQIHSSEESLAELQQEKDNLETTTLPSKIHQDAKSILWLLALQRDKTNEIENLKEDVKLLQHQIHSSEESLAELQREKENLETKKKMLEDELEAVRYFLFIRHHLREFRRKALELWQSVRRACARKYSERKAHNVSVV